MDCISGYIGIRGCGTTTPTSGLYLNDLPGISFKQIVSMTDHDAQTWADLLTTLETRVDARLAIDVRTAFARRYTLKTDTDCSFDDIVCDNVALFKLAIWYLFGYEFMNEVIFSEKLNQYTTVGMSKARELRDYYLVQYLGGTIKEGENSFRNYDGVLNQVVDNFSLEDQYSDCYDCGGSAQVVETNKFY